VTTLSLDAKTGLLTEVSSASALPADTKLIPGAPRPSPGRNVDNDIWASDLHLTPDGKFLYGRRADQQLRSAPSAWIPPPAS